MVAVALAALAARAIPVLLGGGLFGLQGYDDGVYFGSALAFVHGAVPYRDFLFLHPPLVVVALSPFAFAASIIGEPNAFALARVAFLGIGALNAVLVMVVAGRTNRLAGVLSGLVYAVWNAAANGERTTDLHQLENAFLLVALFVLSGERGTSRRATAIAGVAMGLAASDHAWQAASAAVLGLWIVWQHRGTVRAAIAAGAAFVGGAVLAGAVVCLPFLLAAGRTMVEQVVADQVARPNMLVGPIARLAQLFGLFGPGSFPSLVRAGLVLGLLAILMTILIGAAWRLPRTRLWVGLALLQLGIILVTPSFYSDYPSFPSVAIALVGGTALAALASTSERRGVRRAYLAAPIAVALAIFATFSITRTEGRRLHAPELREAVAASTCVAANNTSLLILTSAFGRNLDAGCAIVVDPTGIRYQTDRGQLQPGRPDASMRAAAGFQAAMREYLGSSDAVLIVGSLGGQLTKASIEDIRRRLTDLSVIDGITVLRAP